MADTPNTTPASAQQPGLRALIIYKQLPTGCVAFEVPDDSAAPHIRKGEFVVIDPEDREPIEGELFAITWGSSIDGRWHIVQMDRRWCCYGTAGDPTFHQEEGLMWFVGAPAPHGAVRMNGETITIGRWTEGPYHTAECEQISHGKIVGILEPDFRL